MFTSVGHDKLLLGGDLVVPPAVYQVRQQEGAHEPKQVVGPTSKPLSNRQ